MGWFAPLMGLAGSIGGGLMSMFGANKQNKQAQKLARMQMDFQERMSNTAYQRSVQDMKAAGLNPVMAAFKGGASTPAGATAPVVNEMEGLSHSAKNLGDKLGSMTWQKAKLENELLKEQVEQARLTTAKERVTKSLYDAAAPTVESLTNSAKDFLEGPISLPSMSPRTRKVLSVAKEGLSSGTARAIADQEKRMGRPLEGPVDEFFRLFGTNTPKGTKPLSVEPTRAPTADDIYAAKWKLRKKLRDHRERNQRP